MIKHITYIMETTKGNYQIVATSLLDLFNNVEKIKSSECIHNDEVTCINKEFTLFNYMCEILFEFYEKNELEHLCALDSLEVGNYKNTKQWLFLKRFCNVWEKVEQREINKGEE
mgnify:FL=1